MKRNLFLLAALLLTTTLITSCGKDKPDTSQKGLYVGVIGFNSDLNTKTLEILNSSTKDDFLSFVNDLTMEDGTVLYHAVNTALDKIESITPPDELVNVSIVTFTDGLDQGSYMLNDQYNSGDAYLNAVNERIKNDYILKYYEDASDGDNRVPISAYSIGVMSEDINETTFRNSLEKLSSDPDSNVFLVDNMIEVGQIFGQIAQDLYHESSTWVVTLKTPAPENQSTLRFTFDNVTDASESERYIEGVFMNQDNTCVLNYVTYHGLTDCGNIIYPTTEGIFMVFTFEGLYTTEGEQVYTTSTKQWSWDADNEIWIKNPEFTPSGNIETQKDYKSALVMLVLDCSSSLGNDFESVKSAARQFIETLNGNTHQEK